MPDLSGALCLVLHAHQPFVRRHGAWPCGEDWYHQAASESYLPLAEAFARLADDGLRGFATVSFTPVLASQMADPYLTRELLLFLGRVMLRAERQAANYRGPDRDAIVDASAAAHRDARRLAQRLDGPWSAGAHVPWRELIGSGAVESWTSAPTHAFLPGLRDDELIRTGFAAAAQEHVRVLGARPAGAWLPECGYRPGLEDALSAADVGVTLVDGPAFAAAGADGLAAARSAGVAVLPRDREVSLLVSGPGGYPGAAPFRDFHHYDGEAGFKSFAVTGSNAAKRPYRRGPARAAADDAARAFARAVEQRLDACRTASGRSGTIVAAFDAELFGHWWFEGPRFLETLVRELHAGGRVRTVTASEAAEAARRTVELPPSTWGRGGDASSWKNEATGPIWQLVWEGEEAVRSALDSDADGATLAQALREWLLLASSDWPYMVTMGRAADYARDRVAIHDAALRSLCRGGAAGGRPAGLDELRERDNLLPLLDRLVSRRGNTPARSR